MSQALLPRLLVLPLLLFVISLTAQTPGGDNRRCQEGARISLAFSGDTVRNTCVDDEVMDRLRFQVVPFRQAFYYLVVDANDVVQYASYSNFINFDALPAGQLKVYAFSTYGNILVEVGDTFTGTTLSLPCAGLTENCVVINNGQTGDVAIDSDQDSYSVCAGDDSAGPVVVSTTADNAIFVITDDTGNVLMLNESGTIDFSDAGAGICRIYALAGGLTIEAGENVSTLEGLGGCGGGLSGNFITVEREAVNGGVITTADGEVTTEICPGDGIADLVEFVVDGAEGENIAVIITDESNIVVMLPPANTVNFDPTPLGVCRAWGVAYNGELNAAIGQSIGDILAANGCIDISTNFVLVVRSEPISGTITTEAGETEVQTCPGDGVADVVTVTLNGSSGGEIVYLLTDIDNRILNFGDDPFFDLEGAPVGSCRIWAATYRGSLTFAPNEDVTTATISDNCFALSNNFVTVVRAVPAGGTVATDGGETELTICPGDGAADLIDFVSTGAEATNFTFLVTDADNNILMVTDEGSIDFEGAGLGVCRVWGLAYEGELLASSELNAGDQLATECFSLSENFVTVVRELPAGGTVALANGATEIAVCPMDGIDDILNFVSSGATGDNFAFVVTDDNGEILGFPASGNINFETIDPGICRVYGLAFSGEIVANVGDFIDEVQLATACATLSDNFVTVNRIEASTGVISLEDGGTDALVCPGDALPDVLRFDSTGTTLNFFNYLVTDTNNVILQIPFTDAINFENFPAGVCRVWGFGYNGIVTATVGQVAGVDQLASQCSALSDNFVTVVKQIPDGGTILTVDGEDEVMVCSMDGEPDFVEVASSSASGARFFYVVTDTNNVVITIQDSPLFNFEEAPFGVCRIWGLSFQGTLLIGPEDDLDEVTIADGCADLSDNFVTVVRDDAAAGTISLADGGDEVTICPGDGNPDVVEFAVDGGSGSVIYLITNDQDTLLATTGGPSFDFDGAGTGVCRVYALAFEGDFIGTAGAEVTTADLATGCFALSDNYVTVIRETPVGGSVSLEDGSTEISFCSGDGEDDILRFTNDSGFGSYGYIIADEGIALTAVTSDSFDFSNALTNTLEVYGVAYTGELTVAPGLNIFETDLSSDCFALSDNFITVNITMVDGGDILGNGAEEVYLCPENLEDGFVEFTNNSLISNENYVYVITTANEAAVILNVLDSNSFDFGALPLMEVKVVAISYTGELLAGPGTSLTFDEIATGCVGISNNCVTVFNDAPEAGEISVAGLSSTGISCVVDGDTDISVSTTSESLAGYAIIVTDTNDVVQLVSLTPEAVPFGTLPEGPYRLYGLSYTGNVTVQAGDELSLVALADNCYELTTDFVAIIRGGEITAGTLSNVTTTTGDTLTFCLPAGDAPIVIVQPSIGSPNYRYIVTDTNDRVLVPNLLSNIIPFFAFQPGEYRIYGFNFTGTPSVGVNQILTSAILSTECYALSNFLTVIISDPQAGLITTAGGETEVEVEIDEESGEPTANVTFTVAGNGGGELAYVITDEDNLILGVSADPTINFGPAGPGVCRVWSLSYTGELTAEMDAEATASALSDGCFVLSDDFVTVTRTEEDGLADGGIEGGDLEMDGVESGLLLSAYPNPAAGDEVFITISNEVSVLGGQVSVRDLNGQTHRVRTISGGGDSTTLRFDLTDLAPGVYFVTYVTAEGVQSLQFMKQ